MAHPQTPESGNASAENVLVEDASTQTTGRNSFILVNTRDATTQTGVEEFTSQENTRDSSTQTTEDSLSVLQQSPVTSENSEECRKRKISNVQETTHGSDVCKLPRTETCRKGDEFVSSLKVLPVYSGNTRNINTQEKVASNMNISQKENAPREKSDTDVSKVANAPSVYDMLAVPGPSRCLENKSQSKSCVEQLQNVSPLKQQPSVETEQRQSTCLTCKQTISKHVVEVHHLQDKYKCCRCEHTYSTFYNLQIHVYDEHTKPYYCNECRLNYSEIDSHVPGGTCDECDKCFECRYQLEEHYISEHKDFLKTKCKICKIKFDDHLIAGGVDKRKYQCCYRDCKIRCYSTSGLNEHLCTHSPLKLSKCEVCGGHFKRLQHHLDTVHPFCTLCRIRFVNKYFLAEHRSEEHKEV